MDIKQVCSNIDSRFSSWSLKCENDDAAAIFVDEWNAIKRVIEDYKILEKVHSNESEECVEYKEFLKIKKQCKDVSEKYALTRKSGMVALEQNGGFVKWGHWKNSYMYKENPYEPENSMKKDFVRWFKVLECLNISSEDIETIIDFAPGTIKDVLNYNNPSEYEYKKMAIAYKFAWILVLYKKFKGLFAKG